MSADTDKFAAPPPSVRTVGAALVATLGVQTLAAFSIQSAAVFGPVVTVALGIAPERVGLFIVVSYTFAMFVGLVTPAVVARFGPLRTVQLIVIALAVALSVAAIGVVPSVILAAALTGVANGMTGPVSSHILVERTPPRVMNLVFSIKQTGVPLGAALVGAIVPTLILLAGWRMALIGLAALYCVAVFAFQPLRAEYDRGRDRSARLTFASALAQMRAALRLTLANPGLRELAVVAFVYVGMQMIVVTFLVSYLHFELGYSLVTAGLVYAAMQACGIAGRVIWGAFGDQLRHPRVLLGALGVGAAFGAALLAAMTEGWPVSLVFLVAAAFGLTGVSWNGLHFAEVARQVRREDAGRATAGAMFFSFLGGITGPFVLSVVVPAFGSGQRPFALGFGVIGFFSLIVGLRLIVRGSPTASNEP